MATVKKKVNFDQANHEDNQKSKQKTSRKKTIYDIDGTKLNLVELRRKINKQ